MVKLFIIAATLSKVYSISATINDINIEVAVTCGEEGSIPLEVRIMMNYRVFPNNINLTFLAFLCKTDIKGFYKVSAKNKVVSSET